MKRVHNLVIGGIQNKIFNLILLTVAILTAVSIGVSVYHNQMLTQLSENSGEAQKTAVSQITSSVMNEVVTQTLDRSNRSEAQAADEMFRDVREQVSFLSDMASVIFSNPNKYPPAPYAVPDPAEDGIWTAKVIYADGVDAKDPQIASRVGLAANLSDIMLSMCQATGAANAYMALPEGIHLSVSDTSSSWFDNGRLKSYDPRTRGWYQAAIEAGGTVFTDGEWDANTGAYCLECAAPVYGPDGILQAVIGMDLYLDKMEEALESSLTDGEYRLLVNEKGCAVLEPQEEAFPLEESDKGTDLRGSKSEILAQVISDALTGKESAVLSGLLSDGAYYVTAAPIETTGWVLVSVFRQEIADQPVELLSGSFDQVQSETAAEYQGETQKLQRNAILLLLLATALMLIGGIILGKRIVKPLNTITKRIAHLREGNLEFKMEEAYRTGDEVEELAKSFALLSHKTVEYVDTVKRVTAEKERIGTELALATRIQADMLPNLFPAFPERQEFDIYASMDPAKEVGGDFYDFFLIDNDHLCMVMADVSGKGVPAALFMMASKIILANNAMLGKSPAKVLEDTNAAICANNREEMFVTVWLGIMEISTGKLTAANAGHEYPALKQADGGFTLYRDKHGFVIGGMEGIRYKEYELQLEPGAKLFVYTDGVPEATNAENELFGTERMIDALNKGIDAQPERILRNVRTAVDDFVKEAEQFDGLTMLCMEYRGGGDRG